MTELHSRGLSEGLIVVSKSQAVLFPQCFPCLSGIRTSVGPTQVHKDTLSSKLKLKSLRAF